MKNIKRFVSLLAALSLLTLGGCASAGETASEIEEIRGPEESASTDSTLTGDEAVERAKTFIDGIAPDVFGVSLRSVDPHEIDGNNVYVLNLQVGGNLDGASYEPTLAVDAESGVIYSYYQDGTLTPAAEDPQWLSFDPSTVQELTPEEQQNLAQAESYAEEVKDSGTAEYVQPLKTGQYIYGDADNIYVGYGGSVQQTLTHEGVQVAPDTTTLVTKDMNFDGYEDILLNTTAGAANAYYYLWLYDPAEGNFIAYPGFEDLASPTPNAASKQISTYERGSAADYSQAVWQWDDTGTLQMVSQYAVASDDAGNVTVNETEEDGTENSFTVTSDEYQTASDLMSGAVVDFCISRYGGSDNRTFTFEGMQTVTDVNCYSILMSEDGTPAVRLFIDESATYMVMLDEDCDGTPEETVNMEE